MARLFSLITPMDTHQNPPVVNGKKKLLIWTLFGSNGGRSFAVSVTSTHFDRQFSSFWATGPALPTSLPRRWWCEDVSKLLVQLRLASGLTNVDILVPHSAMHNLVFGNMAPLPKPGPTCLLMAGGSALT